MIFYLDVTQKFPAILKLNTFFKIPQKNFLYILNEFKIYSEHIYLKKKKKNKFHNMKKYAM